MKSVFCLLTTLSLTATVDASLIEYYEMSFKDLFIRDRWIYQNSDAELINSQYKLQFKPSENQFPNAAAFELAANPDPTMLTLGQADPDCGYYLGVRIFEPNEHYYNLTYVEFTGIARSLPFCFPTIYLRFESVEKRPFELIVPIFKFREQDKTKSTEELTTWGEQNYVGTDSLLTTELLEQLSLDPHPIINFKFDWLKILLRFGIYPFQGPSYDINNVPTVRYTTRALVLQESFFEECSQVLARFRPALGQ